MANALIYHMASGQAFFSGVALVTLAVLLATRRPGRWSASGRIVSACVGLALIALSATPLPSWFYLLAGGITLAWLIGEGRAGGALRRGLRGAVLAIWWAGVALEAPYHITPAPARSGAPTLYVVGDSVSAGVGGEAETWPEILARRHGIVVRDLSQPGANVKYARDQARRVEGSASIVLAEIGGNDVLGSTTPDDFERGLDTLLARLRADGRTVVLLELPLPPSFNRFGAIQRRLARRHGVLLVPKRVLLGVLLAEGATIDSVHLSRAGHERMADAIWAILRPAFAPHKQFDRSRLPRVPSPYPGLGISLENYPRVDGSLSTQPLQAMLACKVLGVGVEWDHSAEDDSRTLWPSSAEDFGLTRDLAMARALLCLDIREILRSGGTHEAYLNLIEGHADLALVARLPSADEQRLAARRGGPLDARPVALDAFVILLNAGNPVGSLTAGQVRDIYSGRITNWREVGGPDAPIRPYQRPRNSGSQELMRALVMGGRPMAEAPAILVGRTMGSVYLKLGDDAQGIGYSVYYYREFMAPAAAPIKTCAVGGVSPTAETIRSGRYPFVTPVYVVARRDLPPDHAARRLRDWLLGPAGRAAVEETGYVPAMDSRPPGG